MLNVFALLCLVFINQPEPVSSDEVVFGKICVNNASEPLNFTKHISDIITEHTEFEIIFHYDLINERLVQRIIFEINLNSLKSINLINYDSDHTMDVNLLRRPLVRKILNVIVLEDLDKFSLFLNSTQNVNDQDEALFVISNLGTNTSSLLRDSRVNIFGKVLVIDFNAQQEITVHSVCYFCNKKSKKLIELASSRNGESISDALNLGKKVFDDFQKHEFKIGFIEYFPLIWCDRSDERIGENNQKIKVCTVAKGTEIEVVKTLSKKLNFVPLLIFYDEYADLMEDLVNGKIDFVIGGISATSQRAEKSTFTRQYWFEGFYFLYLHKNNLYQELGRVLDPFDGHLWLLFATTIFITSVVLYYLDRVESRKSLRITCSESVWVCLYMAIEQSTKIKQVFKIRPGPAVLLVCWIFVCLNVSTAYKSKLSATVINPPQHEPGNLEELVEDGYKFIVNDRYKEVFIALLVNTSDPIVQIARKKTYVENGICAEFVYAIENRAAILDEYPTLQYDLRKNCVGELKAKHSDIMDSNQNTHLRITRKYLRNIGQVWLLQKQAVYRTAFDAALSQIVEAGLLEVWRANYTKNMTKGMIPFSHSNHTARYYNPLSLRLLLSLFLLYAVGNGCAVFVFLIEALYYKRNSKEIKIYLHT